MNALAARLHTPGDPLVVESVAREPGAEDHVWVDLAYSPINPFDMYNSMGVIAPDAPRPRTMGVEASGWLDGKPVLVFDGQLSIVKDGLWSQGAMVPRTAIYEAPEDVDLVAASAVSIAGVTARHVVHSIAQVGPGDRVLVLGAAGGVGSLIVNLARLAGADRVIGQTSDPDRAAAIEAQGAHAVVVGGAEALDGTDPTVVFDGLGGAFTVAAVDALAARGKVVTYGTSSNPEATLHLQKLYTKGISLHGFAGHHVTPNERVQHVDALLTAIASGELTVPVEDVIPLKDVNAGLARLRSRGIRGRLVLDLRAEPGQ